MDATKCDYKECPIKEKCYRFTGPESPFRQSYFAEPPFKIIDNKFTCDMYWGEEQQDTLTFLQNIVNP